MTTIGPWYRDLRKPTWNPPDWVFGPAWTVILGLAAWSGVIGLDERLLINSQIRILALFGINIFLAHALEPAILQLAPARLGFDRNPVSLAFDRRADDRVCNDFFTVRLVVGALSALGDICRPSQFDDCSHEPIGAQAKGSIKKAPNSRGLSSSLR